MLKPASIVYHVLKEGLRFTGDDSPMANLLLTMLGAVAEFERSLIKERQREGIAIAKRKGVYKGRKPSLTPRKSCGATSTRLRGRDEQILSCA